MAKYVLFSPVSGTVYMNGVIVPNARVERRYNWRWGEKKAVDETVTDKQGRFSLPEITGTSMSAWLPHEPYVEQDIDVYVDGKKYPVWGGVRRAYSLNHELGGKPATKLRIELTAEATEHVNTAGRFTIEP
jgi:hypothetical protein